MTPRIPTIAMPKLNIQIKTYWIWIGIALILLMSLSFSILNSRPGYLFFPLRQLLNQSAPGSDSADDNLRKSINLANEYIGYLEGSQCSLYVYTSREIASELDQIIRNLATRYTETSTFSEISTLNWQSLLFTSSECADNSRWFEYYVLASQLSRTTDFSLESKWQTSLADQKQELLGKYQESTFQIQERLDKVNQLILWLQESSEDLSNYETYLVLQELQLTLDSDNPSKVQTYNYHALAKLACKFMPELSDCKSVNFIANWNSILSSQDDISIKLTKGRILWNEAYFSELPIQLQIELPNSFPQSFAADQN